MPKQVKNLKYYESIGRRKEAVARVRLYIVGKDKTVTVDNKKIKQGEIIVNDKPIDEYFPLLAQQRRYQMPLEQTNNTDHFAISIRLAGGGYNGQLEATLHGIARALVMTNEEHRAGLKQQGLMTRDPRTRERRKVGTGGRARRAKQSPKR